MLDAEKDIIHGLIFLMLGLYDLDFYRKVKTSHAKSSAPRMKKRKRFLLKFMQQTQRKNFFITKTMTVMKQKTKLLYITARPNSTSSTGSASSDLRQGNLGGILGIHHPAGRIGMAYHRHDGRMGCVADRPSGRLDHRHCHSVVEVLYITDFSRN